jgi:hypothetical protein
MPDPIQSGADPSPAVQRRAGGADQAQSTSKSVTTTTHPIVDTILKSKLTPGDAAVLVGYFGPSPKADYVRLYLSLDLHCYCELYSPVSGGDILLTFPSDPNNSNDPTYVFVKASADIKVVKTVTTGVQASFLQGAIATANLGAAARLVAGDNFSGDLFAEDKGYCLLASTRPHCPPTPTPTPVK